jgi:hypothetical protein
MKYIITGEILLSTVPVPGTVLRKCIFGRNFGILTPFNNLLREISLFLAKFCSGSTG